MSQPDSIPEDHYQQLAQQVDAICYSIGAPELRLATLAALLRSEMVPRSEYDKLMLQMGLMATLLKAHLPEDTWKRVSADFDVGVAALEQEREKLNDRIYAYDKLFAEFEQEREKVRRLRAEYIAHKKWCKISFDLNRPCTCGLAELLKETEG